MAVGERLLVDVTYLSAAAQHPMREVLVEARNFLPQFTLDRCLLRLMETDHVARDDFADHIDIASAGRPSDVAVQRRLGILPVRRARPGAGDRADTCVARTNLSQAACFCCCGVTAGDPGRDFCRQQP